MSNTKNVSKAAALAGVQALIAGTEKHFPSGSFMLGNVTYTTASLLQILQGLVAAMIAQSAAQASAKDALKILQGTEASTKAVRQAYVRFLRAAFNNAAQSLADFGLQPPKARTPLTSEQKTAATVKALATRKARGTTSKKQKLAISGHVMGVTVTPITQPAASPAVQPAQAASSAALTGSSSK